MSVELHLGLLSDGSERVECDVDKIAYAVIVDNGVSRRDLCNLSGYEGVHLARIENNLQI